MHVFARCASQTTHGHARIARVCDANHIPRATAYPALRVAPHSLTHGHSLSPYSLSFYLSLFFFFSVPCQTLSVPLFIPLPLFITFPLPPPLRLPLPLPLPLPPPQSFKFCVESYSARRPTRPGHCQWIETMSERAPQRGESGCKARPAHACPAVTQARNQCSTKRCSRKAPGRAPPTR